MNNKKTIDLNTLKKLSKLSRLYIPNNDTEKLIRDLNQIIGFIDQLNEIDTNNIQPLSSVTGHDLPLREDKINEGNINEQILKNAPEQKSGYFVVPKVIE